MESNKSTPGSANEDNGWDEGELSRSTLAEFEGTRPDFVGVDGGYLYEGGHHETAESLIQVGILGMCACGDPEMNLKYVLEGMSNLGKPSDARSPAQWFFLYWLDTEGFTEHGTSLPGWLTESGKCLLSLLKEWDKLPKEDEGEGEGMSDSKLVDIK